MTRSLKKSNEQFRRAVKRLPLGVASNFRYWGEERTIYVERGKGARLWDIDGNEYIDYRMGYGPAILGYADPRVDAAARAGMDIGGVFALATERELVVAERIAKMVPSAELVRYSNSGTEAVMAALRLARGYSGKHGHIIVEGGYHGLFDAVMWQSDIENWDASKGEPVIKPYSEGVMTSFREHVYTVPLNDANRLEDVLRKSSDKIGAFLIEPIQGNCCSIMSTPEYVRDARALCDKYEVVMIIDEVKTGFRVARGGVQQLLGVQADVCTFAKALANGYPIAVVAGREEIMRKIGRGVAHGGTYTAHSVPLAAAEKTLEILDETDALEQIERYGRRMQEGMSKVLSKRGIAHVFSGHPSMGGLFFSEDVPRNYRDWKTSDYTFYNTMAGFLHELGILCEPDSREPWFIAAAHDDACLAQTLEKFEIAVDQTIENLER
ncbi:MAG: aminotransferase class III-fold pyridoxal phosphate-dependent enzyme [Myxococcales bacterium]|nr:aminotransferase class III-fold pyridoxal phosphate-dependent enzyme [Myxococcales bacterium]MDH5305704.1 aminotransferase class III-fold pyridoxal phosphate-dependent enzyme [Myxococcales bacterium]MDH5566217.1 aminotransferase class III-fold pyridoxal phosphate-dependent enzyme [Myxococcales bacterium]